MLKCCVSEKKFNEFYSIDSVSSEDEITTSKLKDNGLIKNLLFGLYQDKELTEVQTLLFAIKNDFDEFESYKKAIIMC